MAEFLNALTDPNVPFLRYAAMAGLLASVAFGVVGTYVVVRRISYIAGAISHSVLGGIGAGLYLRDVVGWQWCDPMRGAMVVAILAALVIGAVSLYARQREDTVIGAVWAIGMATGVLFLAKTPGYVSLDSYLFGDILLISRGDLWLILLLDVVVVGLGVLFYNTFQAVCFDPEFARMRGVRVGFYYMLLLCLTALTVVLLVNVVGIVLMIALLTLPAAVAGHVANRLWQMMGLAVVSCMAMTTAGLGVSYEADLPSGPTIIVGAGLVYLVVVGVARLMRGRTARRAMAAQVAASR